MQNFVDELICRYPALKVCRKDISGAYRLLERCFERNGKLLIAGNGGSAADSEHIVGELMKCFQLPRPVSREFADRLMEVDLNRGKKLAANLERGLAAIPIATHVALTSAYINDVDGEDVFAQQVLVYGQKGDVFLGLSTSGNSENILNAAVVAKAMEMDVIALTGKTGGNLISMADIAVRVPETETYLVQEMHLPVYHCWCRMLEEHFFGIERERHG